MLPDLQDLRFCSSPANFVSSIATMAAGTATDAAPAEASSTSRQTSRSRSRRTDEETPLLKGAVPPEEELDQEEVILPAEMSNKKLFLTLGSIYIGVFLAALDSVVIA